MTPDYNKAATYAAITLIKLGINSVPIFPDQLIRQCKNTALMAYKDYCALPYVSAIFPDAITFRHPEALTHLFETNGEKHWIVYYDPAMIHGDRWKFSMAHELGHIVMQHHGHSMAEEAEADFFAAHLLLPRPIIAELISRCVPLFEVNLYNLSNVSKACLWTMQKSEAAYVKPEYNAILRKRFKRYIDERLKDHSFWLKAEPNTVLYSMASYMEGYKD